MSLYLLSNNIQEDFFFPVSHTLLILYINTFSFLPDGWEVSSCLLLYFFNHK